MIAVRNDLPRFTPEEYFAWEEQQRDRYEYIGGEVYAMTGGSLNHSEVAGRFITMLNNHLKEGKWDIINYQAGDLVELASINLKFSIEDVYQEIIFELA